MKRWFKMQLNDDDNDSGEIMIYDMIGKDPWTGDGMDATDFDTELKALGSVKNINLRINSPGGDVFDGLAIFNMIDSHPATVTATVDGIAASTASLIVMAADKIVMPENSFMLIHKPRGMVFGTDDDMVSMAADLERMGSTFANAYASRTGQTPEDVTALMCEDRLMTASEAKTLGYCNEIASPVKMVAAFDMKRLPEKARLAMSAAIEAATEPVVVEPQPAVALVEPPVPAVTVPPAVVEPPVAVAAPPAYGDAEIHATLDLCQLANMSMKASVFIKAKMPLDKVREQLLAARASIADRHEIDTTPPTTPTAHVDEWKAVHERVRASMKSATARS